MAKMQWVRVTRSFNFECSPLPVGKVLELPLNFAIELRSASKVEFVDAPTQNEVPERTVKPSTAGGKSEPESKPESKPAKPRKGD